MLDGSNPSGRAPRPFLSHDIIAEVASEPWQRRAYASLRGEIFVREQAMFDASDWDEHDASAIPIVALGRVLGIANEVVGVVRIYPAGGGTWYGGRLGVARDYRRVRSEEHTSELQSRRDLVCRLLLEKKK